MGVPIPRDGQAGLPSEKSTASYWHKEPSKLLLGHRTTKLLPSQADVVVVGSGITGAIAARCLLTEERTKHLSVAMVEAREACWGATGRNGGHCQPNVYATTPEVAAFEVRTFNYLRDLVTENDIPCDWVSTTGAHGFFSQPLFDQAVAHFAKTKSQDPSLDKLGKAITVSSEDPSLTDLAVPTAVGAMWQANAASLWPYKLVAWVLEDLIARYSWRVHGWFNLQTNTPVTHLQRLEGMSGSSYSLASTSISRSPSGPQWIVHTTRGQIVARHVLIATNGYVSNLLPEFSDLIVPVRGQVATLVPPDGNENPVLDHTYVFLAENAGSHDMDDYLIQRPELPRELIFGGGRDFAAEPTVGVSNDDVLDEATSAHLKSILGQILDVKSPAHGEKNLDGGNTSGSISETKTAIPKEEDGDKATRGEEMQSTFEWTGIMGFSRDGHPWVGRVPESLGGGDGLWLCAGYTGHGMPHAALCAKAVVDLMAGADLETVDLPRSFLIEERRARSARTLEEVKMADAMGIGLFGPMPAAQ